MSATKTINLITKQINLLSAIAQLADAARMVENEELVIHANISASKQVTPIANAELQADFLTEAVCDEIRGSILENMDNKVNQLESLGITISAEALAEIQTTAAITNT